MRTIYFISFALSFFISFVLTFFVARFAVKRNILLDVPDAERRLHEKPTPTLGGLAVFGTFFLVSFVVGLLGGYLVPGNIPLRTLFGIWIAGLVLMIGGFLDDKYRLPPFITLIFPVLASLVVISLGIKAASIHNPFSGDIVNLGDLRLLGLPLASGLVVFLWTMTMTYTTKLLDGMDGLVSGVSVIGGLALFVLSLTPQVMQPQTALLAIIFAGSMLGFLILNTHPAKIFLGEGGSTYAGFMLAVLAVVSGGKMATTLLVMGIPLLDAIWVVVQRIANKESPFKGDRKHLHYKLNDIGFSQPQAVMLLYALTGIFATSALFLQSRGKLIALIFLFLVMLAIVASVLMIIRKRRQNVQD